MSSSRSGIGLGDDHVVHADGERVAEVPLPRRPGAGGVHHLGGGDGACGRDEAGRPPRLEALHRRALEDAHAALQQYPAQLAGELGRLEHRQVRRHDAADEARRVGDMPSLGGVHTAQAVGVTVRLEQPERLLVRPGLPLPGARVEDALVVGVDAGLVAGDPRVELGDHLGEGGGVCYAAALSKRPAQRGELEPRGREEAAVGAAAPGAADVGLEEHDVQRRIALGELVGGPEAAEAAAGDAHVGARLS